LGPWLASPFLRRVSIESIHPFPQNAWHRYPRK
jgi:hypothetical protein